MLAETWKCWQEHVQEPLYTVGENVNWCRELENNIQFPQKTKNRTTI